MTPQTHPTMLAALAERTRQHLGAEMDITVQSLSEADTLADPLTLEHLTAVMGIGGPSGLLLAFSFSPGLAETLFQRTLDALGLPEEDAAAFRDACLTEFANVVAGRWIGDFAPPDTRISLTPPVLIEGARRIHRVPNATFHSLATDTDSGRLGIHLIGPQSRYDLHLEAA